MPNTKTFLATKFCTVILALIVCLSVCVSHASTVLHKSSCFLDELQWDYMLLWTYATLYFKEISVSLKIKVLSSETLSRTLDFIYT